MSGADMYNRLAILTMCGCIGWVTATIATDPVFLAWWSRHGMPAPTATCTCPPAPVSPVATPTEPAR